MDYNIERCPFCNGEGIINHRYETVGGKVLEGSVVICRTCGAKGPWYPIDTDYSCNERAANAWNQRA